MRIARRHGAGGAAATKTKGRPFRPLVEVDPTAHDDRPRSTSAGADPVKPES